MPRKKSSAQLDREISQALGGPDAGALHKLVDKWKAAAAFNYARASEDPDDAPYRNGYAAAAETIVSDLQALLAKSR